MHTKNYQEFLDRVRMPTRYIGGEVNSVVKNPEDVKLTFALAFPDLYEIGTSYFGGQILYHILNRRNDTAAERFYTPASDMEALMAENAVPMLSLENSTPLSSFDIIGFSLLYELNFTNILTMLKLSGIPFFAEERADTFPLIIAGGPCAFNPEPVAEFFDAVVIGDGEEVLDKLADMVIRFKEEGGSSKKSLLKELAGIQGVYVPSFFTPVYDDRGVLVETRCTEDGAAPVKRSILGSFDDNSFPVSPFVPFAKPVHDRLRLEIARGCSRGCRFCQAGMIYRPVRERSRENLIEIAQKSLDATGYRDISLLSLSTGDYSNLESLMEELSCLNKDHLTSISLPSVRAEKLTPGLMEIIRKVRKTGFTIAPEAGSQRLRDVINKKITEQEIFDTVNNAFQLGWQHIKLYFMVGLPHEKQADIEAICSLSRRLAGIKTKGSAKGRTKVNVSVAAFIPKAHTAFQRSGQISSAQAFETLDFLKENLRHPGINLKWQDPRMSMLEGVFARGDRRLAKVLAAAHENGCRLDGWADMFRFDLWERTFAEQGIDPDFYLRERARREALPWDHIDSGISSEFLEKECRKAAEGVTTADCRDEECTGCGICDFETVAPVLDTSSSLPGSTPSNARGSKDRDEFIKYEVFYSKLGRAGYFGHLEFAKIIRRAVRRAGLRVKYTRGFNPEMKIAFNNPLPVGMESEEEFFILHADAAHKPAEMADALNACLPGGINVNRIEVCSASHDMDDSGRSVYKVVVNGLHLEQEAVDRFMACDEWILEDVSGKGKKRTTDLRQVVEKIEVIDSTLDSCHLSMVLQKCNQRIIRPGEILKHCFHVPEDILAGAVIRKLKQDF